MKTEIARNVVIVRWRCILPSVIAAHSECAIRDNALFQTSSYQAFREFVLLGSERLDLAACQNRIVVYSAVCGLLCCTTHSGISENSCFLSSCFVDTANNITAP